MTHCSVSPCNVAVVGAGIAGATCAQALREAGHAVRMFDKSRGPGGRLATRRALWVDALGQARTTRFDHGAPGFDARSPAFRRFTAEALKAGWLAAWAPAEDRRGLALEGHGPFLLPVPDMPALCRQLLQGTGTSWASPVAALQQGPSGWRLQGADALLGEGFDAVVLALPPAQAGALLADHHRSWARHAALALMQPCWTLMGVAPAPAAALAWEIARPPTGPLAWVQRNDSRPGRERRAGEVHWVLHARAAWSRLHLEQPADWVQAQLQTGLSEWLGESVHWSHAVTHCWRYAMPQASTAAPSGDSWWDAALGLGVCGDFLGGGGVEGAWLSARALAAAMAGTPSAHASDSQAAVPAEA